MTARDGFAHERAALARTLAEVGPDAPTLCAGWTAADLAAHVASGEALRGLFAFPGRLLICHSPLRLSGLSARVAPVAIRQTRRRGFEWAVQRLAARPPWLLSARSIAPVTLAEVFVHHEDVRRANGYPARADADLPDLTAARDFLVRYQRRQLAASPAPLDGPVGEVVLRLAGRAGESGLTI